MSPVTTKPQAEVRRNGVGTLSSIGFAILFALKPVADQIIALVENTNAHWATGDKVSLIASGALIAVAAVGKFAQAVAAILKGA